MCIYIYIHPRFYRFTVYFRIHGGNSEFGYRWSSQQAKTRPSAANSLTIWWSSNPEKYWIYDWEDQATRLEISWKNELD